MTIFKKKPKKRKYDTDIEIGGIIHIRHEDPCLVNIHGNDPGWLTATVSTTHGAFYTIKLKSEEIKKNEVQKNTNSRVFSTRPT